MSKIEYLKDAEAAIAKAGKEAAQKFNAPSDRMAYELGYLRGDLKILARRAELDSQLPQIRERIASSMTFDLCEASELIDAIIAGIKRQHGDMPDVFIPLGDAAQALYEAEEIKHADPVDDRDHYEEAALDAKHRAAAQREVA